MSLIRSGIIPLSLITLSLIGCGSIETNAPTNGQSVAQTELSSGSPSDRAIAEAQKQPSAELAAPFYLSAANSLYKEMAYAQARTLLETHVIYVPSSAQFDGLLLFSDIAVKLNTPLEAIKPLELASQLNNVQNPQNMLRLMQYRGDALAAIGNWTGALNDYMQLSLMLPYDQQSENQRKLWIAVQNLTENELNSLQGSQQYLLDGWIEVSKILRNQSLTIEQQVDAFRQWQTAHSSHPAAITPPADFQIIETLEDNMPTSVAILLPMSKELKMASEAILDGILQQYYANKRIQPQLHIIDTDSYANFADAYNQALTVGAQTIIGPLRKQNVTQVNQLVGSVPTIALNQLETNSTTPNLYHFSLNVSDDIRQLIAYAKKEGATNSAVLSTEATWALRQSEQYQQIANEMGVTVVDNISYEDTPAGRQDAIKKLLRINESEERIRRVSQWTQQQLEASPRSRQDLSYIYFAGKLDDAKQIRPLLNFYFADNIPMLASQTLHDKTPSPTTKSEDIEKIIFSELPSVMEPGSLNSPTPLVLQRLTALGNDSFLLAKRLALFTNVSTAKVSAKTGIITLGSDGNFNRRPNIVTYKQGALIDVTDHYFENKEAN